MECIYGVDLEELCPVCGDNVSGYHYGLLTCESCKGFFKRTVQNNKRYTCAESQECKIDKTQRKRCPFCRFQKCLTVGMRLEAVRADRMRGGRNKFGPMYKRDRALKQQKKALNRESGVKVESMPPVMSPDQTDYTLSNTLPNLTDISTPKNIMLNMPFSNTSAEYEQGLYTTPGCISIGSHSPLQSQYPHQSLPCRTIKSEFPDHYASSSSPGSTGGYTYTFQNHTINSPTPHTGLDLPALVLEIVHCEQDELLVRSKISTHLALLQQNQSSGSNEALSTFAIMCHIADQTLFFIVEWARSCSFFKKLKVGDQMKLLQNCWSELLVLDFISRQVHHDEQDTILLITGQKVGLTSLLTQAGVILGEFVRGAQQLVQSLQKLHLDCREITCFKYLILFNPDVKLLENQEYVESVYHQVSGALLEYTLTVYPQYVDRFSQLLLHLRELRVLSTQAEDYLSYKHLNGEVPCNKLLIEMLYAKRACD